ncbi:MAG TPA: Ig-like domain-containing protein, partial [Bacteroidales bacterium]|nr:Ig-like domain-containing protein [Bacteroidales bacterium]
MKTHLPYLLLSKWLRRLLTVFVLLILLQSVSLAQLSGTYTIGTGGDYTSFADVTSDLNTLGVSGPVTFNILSGTYDEQLTVPYIPNTSEVNTVVFQSATGDSTDVVIRYTATGSDDNFVLKLKQCNFVTIRGLTFTALNDVYGRAVLMEEYVYNTTLENNCFNGTYNTNARAELALVNANNAALNNVKISNNYFTNGSYAIFINSSNQYNNNSEITNNIIENPGYAGIYLNRHNGTVVSDNRINGGSYGVYLIGSGNSVQVTSNWLTEISRTGLMISNMKSAANFESLVANNTVSMTENGNTGIQLSSCSFVNLYNNSVLLNTDYKLAKVLYLNYCIDQTINVMNNNLVALDEGFAIYSLGTGQVKNCDYNNYYTTGRIFAYWGENCEDFRTLKMVSGKDAHSLFAWPNFTSTATLQPNSAWLDDAGTPLDDVTEDIDGTLRDETHPDIGAVEFAASASVKPALSGVLTIGNGGNYATLNEAVADVQVKGISDTIRLQLLPGYYEEQCVIPPVTGASSNSPVIIESSTGNHTNVHIWHNANDQYDNYILKLKGASFLMLRDLTFDATDSRCARILDLEGMVDSLFVISCKLNSTEQHDANACGIVIFSNNLNFHQQYFENDSFSLGGTALMYNLNDPLTKTGNFYFQNNVIQNAAYAHLNLRNILNPVIIGNKMTGNMYGSDISYATKGLTIEKNDVYCKYGSGFDLNNVTFEDFTTGLIANNFIASDYASPNQHGLKLYNCNKIKIYYNSISMYSGSNKGVPANIQNSENITLKDNIFSNKGLVYSIYINNTTFDAVDYNCFYSEGTALGYWGEVCADLAAIQTASSANQHSIMANPGFLSATNLHTYSPLLDGKGSSVSGIDTDIDGDTRNAVNPDIGADEFTIVPNEPPWVNKPIEDISFPEDGGPLVVALLDTVFADPNEEDVLVFTTESDNPDILAQLEGTVLSVNSSLNYAGEGKIVVTAKDNMNETARDTFNVMITPVNDPPIAMDDNYNVTGETVLKVLENDYDVDGDTLVIISVEPPMQGNVSILPGDTTLQYLPTDFSYDNDTLWYVISDQHGETDTARVVINRNAIPDNFTLMDFAVDSVSHGSVAWGDYDGDGDLDFAMTGWLGHQEEYITKIFKNTGNGFEDSGITLMGVSPGTSNAVSWTDYDNDDDLDLIIMGRENQAATQISTIFYENVEGSFVETADVDIKDLDAGSFDWGDYNNDGRYDLLVSGNAGNGQYHTLIYRNIGATPFGSWALEEVDAGLTGIWSGESTWVDFDNDGDLDIFVCGFNAQPSIIYLNDQGEFSPCCVNIMGVGNAAAEWGDYDQDGDQDLVLSGKIEEDYFTAI